MPQPTAGDVHIDVALSQLSIAFKNQLYIAGSLAPQVPVGKQSDKYYVWTKDFWFRNYVQKRTPGDTYPEAGLELSSDSYFAEIYHLAYPLPDEVLKNQDAAVDLERAGSEWLADQFALNREILARDTYFTTGVWENDVTGGTDFTKWDDFAASDPIDDINTGQQTVQKDTGILPKSLVIGKEVWDMVRQHPLLLDKYKHVGVANLNHQQVADALDLDRIIVGEAIANSAQEGAAFSGGYLWGKKGLLAHITQSPGLMVANAAYTFVWNVDDGGLPIQVSRIREDNRDRDLLKAKHAFDEKVVSKTLGYFLDSIMD